MHVQTKCLYLLYIDTINSENPLTHPTSVCSDSNFCQQVPYKNNLLDFGTELLADVSANLMRHKLATSRFNCYRITKVHVLALCHEVSVSTYLELQHEYKRYHDFMWVSDVYDKDVCNQKVDSVQKLHLSSNFLHI